jgi:hypothetical protein
MAINLTDELNAATSKGKLGSAKQIYLEGDTKTLEQKSSELDTSIANLDKKIEDNTDSIKNIAVTGGASVASAVTYDNTKSGLASLNQQAATDELAASVSSLETKVPLINEDIENLQNRVTVNETKTSDNETRLKDFEGFKIAELPEYAFAIVDANDNLAIGITNNYGEVDIPHGIPREVLPLIESLKNTDSKNYNILKKEIDNLIDNLEITNTSLSKEIEERKETTEKVDTLRKDFDNVGHLTFFGNDEYILAAEDSNGNLIVAFKRKDGTQYAHGITEDVQKLFDSVGHLQYFKNDKYILATEDIDGNVLFGFLRANGKLDIQRNLLPQWLLDELDGLQEKFNSIADLNAINVENNEFIEFTTDKDGLIVRGTRTNGEAYIPKGLPEEQKPINTKVDKRLTALENTLENFEGGTGDWSEETSLKLPMPTVLARVDIEGSMPTSKYVQVQATLTFRDVHGNSFTKPIMISLQGNISSGFDKKNFSFDLYNSIKDDESFDLQFDGWVPQDGYHLKAYISDFWKIRSLCVYRHAEQISQYRPYFNRRPWSSLIGAANQTAEEALKGGVGDVAGEVNDFALGRPDGFPVMLYYNGIPWGLYTWNLKKNKDNYHITKNDAEGKQLFFGDHMSGVFQRYNTTYWTISNYNLQTIGDIEPWDENKDYEVGDVCYDEETIDFEVGGKTSSVTIRRAFKCVLAYKHDVVSISYNTYRPSYMMWKELEVRNPKTTICKETDGTFQYYDYDSPSDYAQTGYYERTHEIISENDLTQKQATALGFSKKEYTRSIAARKTIDAYSYVCPILDTTLTAQNLEDWGFTTEAEAKKAIFAEHHDLDFNLDFFLVYNDCNQYDSIKYNTLYTMYDGKKLFAHIYDTDISLGMNAAYANSFPSVSSSVLSSEHAFTSYLWTYYSTEIKARWKELRDAGIISAEAMEKLVWQMVESVGVEAYEEEARLWSQPAYRSPVYWRMIAGSLKTLTDEDGLYYHGYDESLNTEKDDAETWVSGTSYIVGDVRNYNGHSYTCTAAHTSTDALTPDKCYTCGSPTSGGVYDSPRRVIEWFKKRVEYLDTKFGYTSNN